MVKFAVSGNSLKLIAPEIILNQVRLNFSVENQNFSKNIFADPRTYAITPSGSFHVGLLKEIQNFLIVNRIPFETPEEVQNRYSKRIEALMVESLNGITYRDYQLSSITEFFLHGRGIVELPTSAGKTAVMAGVAKTYLKYNTGKILIIVPNKLLLEQSYEDLKKFGISDIDKFSGENPDTDWNSSVIVSTFAMLTQRKKTKNPNPKKRPFAHLKKFENYDLIIVDEVHQLSEKSNAILKFVSNCKTIHKLGMTGTIPDDPIARWNMIGRIGPVLYREKSLTLREAGYISDVFIQVVKFIHRWSPPSILPDALPNQAYIDEKEFLMRNKKRNGWIVKLCKVSTNNILILVDRIEHGQILEKLLKNNLENKQIYFACGETSTEERTYIKQMMETNDNVICVAITKLFSTGVSINNLPWVIMTGIGKSKIQLFQTIGRSLRLHENKERATIFDLSDDTYYSSLHLEKRIEFYGKEEISYQIKEI